MDRQAYLLHVRETLRTPTLALQITAIIGFVASLAVNPYIERPFTPYAICLAAGMAAVCAFKGVFTSTLIWRVGTVTYAALLALAFRQQMEAMRQHGEAYTLPLVILLSVGFSGIVPLRRDYCLCSLLVWGILLAGRSHPLPAGIDGPLLGLLLCFVPMVGLWLNHAVVISLRSTFELHAEFRRLASTDPLTGLPNRRALLAHLELARQPPEGRGACYFAMLDLDDFKRINDQHGHEAGDAVLVALADALRSRPDPDMAGRLGGEEFGILLNAASAAHAQADMQQLLEQFMAQRVHDVTASFSAGLVRVYPDESVQSLLRRADAALYRAKRAGKAQVAWQELVDAGAATAAPAVDRSQAVGNR